MNLEKISAIEVAYRYVRNFIFRRHSEVHRDFGVGLAWQCFVVSDTAAYVAVYERDFPISPDIRSRISLAYD